MQKVSPPGRRYHVLPPGTKRKLVDTQDGLAVVVLILTLSDNARPLPRTPRQPRNICPDVPQSPIPHLLIPHFAEAVGEGVETPVWALTWKSGFKPRAALGLPILWNIGSPRVTLFSIPGDPK